MSKILYFCGVSRNSYAKRTFGGLESPGGSRLESRYDQMGIEGQSLQKLKDNI